MLRTRPTRRELVSSQLEVDRLQREVHNLHTRVRSSGAKRKELQPEFTEISVLERVGRLCSDIVASCCYVLEVEEVGELPDCVQRSHQLARVSTIYQEFVERIEKLLKRFDKVRIATVLYLCL
eukprot:jgi/Phyca11/131425/e_gw1.105.56.1